MDTTVLKVGKLAVHNDGNTYSVIESEQDGTCIFRKTGMCLMEAVTLFTDTFGMRANQWARKKLESEAGGEKIWK